MIEFDCPQCHHHITAPDQDAGKDDACPRCESAVTIPAPQLAAAQDDSKTAAAPAMNPDASAATNPATPGEARIPCPDCGEMIAARAKKCRFCGKTIETAPEVATGRVPCPVCGEMIVATAKKCRFCGEVLSAASAPAPRGDGGGVAASSRPAGSARRSPSRRGNAELAKGIWDYLCDFWWYKYHDFDGRATRREFWLDQLHQFLSFIVLSPAYPVWFLVTLVPTLALVWRRSHDIGKPGSYGMKVSLIPIAVLLAIIMLIVLYDSARGRHNDFAVVVFVLVIVGPLVWRWFGVNILGFVRGTDGPNEYGPDPYDED